jgi:hypothetical protein
MKYVHASDPLDIGCNFEAVDELVLSNLTRSSFQYTDYLELLLYWSNPVSQVLRAMAVKRTTRGRSNFGELMTVKIS